jgi:hypothetical protein
MKTAVLPASPLTIDNQPLTIDHSFPFVPLFTNHDKRHVKAMTFITVWETAVFYNSLMYSHKRIHEYIDKRISKYERSNFRRT